MHCTANWTSTRAAKSAQEAALQQILLTINTQIFAVSEVAILVLPELLNAAFAKKEIFKIMQAPIQYSILALLEFFLSDLNFLSWILCSLAILFLQDTNNILATESRWQRIMVNMLVLSGFEVSKEGEWNHRFAISFAFSGSGFAGIIDSAARSKHSCNFSSASSTLSLQRCSS